MTPFGPVIAGNGEEEPEELNTEYDELPLQPPTVLMECHCQSDALAEKAVKINRKQAKLTPAMIILRFRIKLSLLQKSSWKIYRNITDKSTFFSFFYIFFY